jgi:hypothetical protein
MLMANVTKRRGVPIVVAVLLVTLSASTATAGARPTRRRARTPLVEEPTCVVRTLPGSFADQGEFGTASSVADVVEVECQPVYAEHFVELSAIELSDRCHDTLSWAAPPQLYPGVFTGPQFFVQLDDAGNATAVVWGGPSCAAGESLISAHLVEAPYTTVTTAFTVLAPRPGSTGLTVSPEKAVEDAFSSSVATIVEVRFPSVYAEQTVNINAAQLYDRCKGPGPRLEWVGPDEDPLELGEEVAGKVTLDNDGSAFVVLLAGTSCASGPSTIEASLESAPYTTYTGTFEVEAPQPTV